MQPFMQCALHGRALSAYKAASRDWVMWLGVWISHGGVCNSLPAASQPGDLRPVVHVWVSTLRAQLQKRSEWAECSKEREWPAATIYPKACDDGDVGRHVLCHEFMLGDPYCQPVNRRS